MLLFIDIPEQAFRIKNAEDIISLRHTGWYCDTLQDDTFRGVVCQVSGKHGKSRCFAGYRESFNYGVVIDTSEVFDCERDAAYAADSLAEIEAEKARDHDTAWQAGALWRDLGEEIADNRRKLIAILAERRQARRDGSQYPAMCAALRDTVTSLLRQIAEDRDARQDLANGDYARHDYYLGFWTGSKELCAAFNDGAGATVL